MKRIKLSTEAIVGVVAAIIILLVLLYAFRQKREIIAIETHKKAETAYVDSMQNVVSQINSYYKDTLLVLDHEIETLKSEIDKTQSKQVKYENYAKLDRMISMSKDIIQENEELLVRLKEEPLKSEYAPQLLADLIEALIENIQLKEKKIIELQAEVNVLKEELESQKSLTKQTEIQREKAQEEAERKALEAEEKSRLLAKVEAEKAELMAFQYILGSQKDLLKEEILTKKLFKKECFMANDIAVGRFTTINVNVHDQTIVLGKVDSDEIFCAPALSGANFQIENGQLIIHITNINELINNGRVVFYY